jgi:branched-chain amino acid transport system substrate-binding protein
MKRLNAVLATVLLATVMLSAQAQILIGQTVAVTGQIAPTVKETALGASLYIDMVNSRGGIRGEKIEIITLDDKFEINLTLANAKTLIEQRQVVAMFMPRGTPHTQGIFSLLDQYGVPLIAPATGAKLMNDPVQPHVFNLRATYHREAEKAVHHLTSIGTVRIAILHVDDAFGIDGLEGTLKGLEAAKLKPVLVAKFARTNPDFSGVIPGLVSAKPQAVMVIGSGSAVVAGIRAAKASGVRAQFVTLSNNASDGFIKQLGADARGVMVAQVMPNSYAYPLVKEANELAAARKISDVSPAMLEGFAAAKVLVEALRRTTGKPTRASVKAALNSMRKFDLGGLEINYSPTDHTGLKFSDLSIINESGKFMR